MNSAFSPKTGAWEIGWPGRVAKYDLVYLSPPCDPMQGMPLGNGDVGALCWCEDSRIIIALNKCDLWDDAEFGRFHNWKSEEEEYSTTLRHACRIILDFKMPVFNLFYLSDFDGRLSIADASLSMTVKSPFGSISFKAFVSHDDGILCCKIESNFKENIPVEIIVERFGSRTFSHWYTLINRNTELGIKGTQSSFDRDSAYISHRLTSGEFAVGCRVVNKRELKTLTSIEHSHASKISLSGSREKKFSIMVAVISPVYGDPVKAVKQKLAIAKKKSRAALFEAHKKNWKAFWLRSLMEYGDDYLDNLWHLTMYYANASQRGSYPARMVHGLWAWNRDVQNWNFYFHWNQQPLYWPLNATGHHDLVNSYLEYRFNSLPHAKRDALELFGTDGAYVSDVAERRGYNSSGDPYNHTPVAQIAMDFWRQYKYTGNKEFLKTRALPYLLEAAYFFESLFEKSSDGKYHAREGTGYEGWIKLKDCITELVYGKVLFSAAIKALEEAGVEESHAGKWREIIDNLAALPVVKAKNSCFEEKNGQFKLKRGLFKRETAFSDKILASGFSIKEKRWLTSQLPLDEIQTYSSVFEVIQMMESEKIPLGTSTIKKDMKIVDGIFPGTEWSAVFPSGLLGLSQKGSGLFQAAVNTAKLYSPECMGWEPLPVVLARLGLSIELSEILKRWPSNWQLYCNGFAQHGTRDMKKADAALKFRTNLAKDASLPEEERKKQRFPFPTWPFRHMCMDPMSILACAMNESLLQTYDGVIRVAPAVEEGQNARFTLHAEDGFIVSAEIKQGKPVWISVHSLFGKICRIKNPWDKLCLLKSGVESISYEQDTVEFSTQKGDAFMIVPEEATMKNWKIVPVEYQRNESPKTDSSGNARLGLPRMF